MLDILYGTKMEQIIPGRMISNINLSDPNPRIFLNCASLLMLGRPISVEIVGFGHAPCLIELTWLGSVRLIQPVSRWGAASEGACNWVLTRDWVRAISSLRDCPSIELLNVRGLLRWVSIDLIDKFSGSYTSGVDGDFVLSCFLLDTMPCHGFSPI